LEEVTAEPSASPQTDFGQELRADVPWDKPDPEPWPPTIDDEPRAEVDPWVMATDWDTEAAQDADATTTLYATSTGNDGGWEAQQPSWGAAAISQNGWGHELQADSSMTMVEDTRDEAPAVAEWSAEEPENGTTMSEAQASDAMRDADDVPWETFDQAVAAAEPPSVEAFSAHWDGMSQAQPAEAVAESATSDASPEWNWDAPAEQVTPSPEWNWDTPAAVFTEPAAASMETSETAETAASTETAETVAGMETTETSAEAPAWQWDATAESDPEPVEMATDSHQPEASASPWDVPAQSTTEPVDTPAWQWELPTDAPVEAVVEPVAESFDEPAEATSEIQESETPAWLWDSPTEQTPEPVEAVAEPHTEITEEPVEAVAETAAEPADVESGAYYQPVEAVVETAEPADDPVQAMAETTDEPVEAVAESYAETAWETVGAVAETADEPVEAVADTAEMAHEPVEAVADPAAETDAETTEEPVEAVAEAHDQPVSAVAEPVTIEFASDEPEFAPADSAAAVAAVATEDVANEVVDQADEDEMDSFVEDRPSWDMPEPFEFDDDGEFDDRPTDMLASYDEMMPIVTAAVAAAKTQPAAEPVHASAEDSAAQDPDDAMAPVLNDVDQPQVPNWTLWQPPVDVADGRPVHQPAFVGKVVGPTPPADLFEDAEPTDKTAQPDQPQTTAQVIGASIASEVGDAVVHQVPALYSTAPYGIQQPLVVRIELTIVDESNKLRAAEMARPVGPWSDVPVDTDEFDDDLDDQDEPVTRAPLPPKPRSRSHWDNPMASAPPARQASDPGASAWAIPALDDDRPPNGRATGATWAPMDHEDPLADLPAAPYGTASQAHRPAPAPQANSQGQPAWFDSAAPVRTVNPPPSHAQANAKRVQGVQPASNGDQSDLWFLASEPDGYVANQPSTEKAQSSRMVMIGMTVVMAAVVVLLVLVFIQLMTSLLK